MRNPRAQDHHIRRLLAVNPSTDKEKRHAQ